MGANRITSAATVLAFASALALAPSAGAAVTCNYEVAGIVDVRMSQNFDSARLHEAGNNIEVRNGQDQNVACTGGTPTTTNTNTVLISDDSDDPSTPAGGDGTTQARVVNPTAFAPGKTLEGGNAAFSEIEFIVNLGSGEADFFQLFGGPGNDNWALGNSGLNWNAGAADPSPDSELVLSSSFDRHGFQGAGGNDTISGQGGPGAGAAYTGDGSLEFYGEQDNDTMRGGDTAPGKDSLFGREGNDTLQGFAGADSLDGGLGDDSFDGGAGSDAASYYDSQGGATVDLNQAGPQNTGDQGSDTITAVENVAGSDRADTLIGNAGPNKLLGSQGNDTIDGRAGNDELRGGADEDTVTYAQAPAGVTVNLDPITGTASGGSGSDKVEDFENLTGSPFIDSLTGNNLPNRITGGAGSDGISALGGADTIDIRDGDTDIAACGLLIDTVTADRKSQDSVDPDCENVDYLPELPAVADAGNGNGAATPRAGDGDDFSLRFELTGARIQRVLKQKAIVVKLRCPAEACTAVAGTTGKLTLRPVLSQLRQGATRTVKLKLSKAQRRSLARSLAKGKRPKAKVTVQAVDGAGNRVTRSLSVTAKR